MKRFVLHMTSFKLELLEQACRQGRRELLTSGLVLSANFVFASFANPNARVLMPSDAIGIVDAGACGYTYELQNVVNTTSQREAGERTESGRVHDEMRLVGE